MLNRPDLFFVVFLDATAELDVNNLNYTDVLMGLAKALFGQLADQKIPISKNRLKALDSWFFQQIKTQVDSQDFAASVKAGGSARLSLPFVAKLFAKITNRFKINSTYKDELRRVIQNSFSDFAAAFNGLIEDADENLQKMNKGRKLLFIVDGTDRLKGQDSEHFFIHDTHQLQLIRANFIYCGPVHLLYENNQIQQVFKPYILPMIKLTEPKGETYQAGYRVLKDMILKRVDASLFDSVNTRKRIIEFSGGSPREVIRLLRYVLTNSKTDRFDEEAVDGAIHELAVDYQRFLQPEDYHILHAIDNDLNPDWEMERENSLLYNLALLEYNGDYWRRPHPVIRTLKGYQQAVSESKKKG